MRDLLNDLKLALRQMHRRPGFATAAILCLGLGIGVNTAVYSLAEALFFRQLPVQQPERLVRVYTSYADGLQWGTLSYPDFEDLRREGCAEGGVLQGLVAEQIVPLGLAGDERDVRIYASLVSPDYFQVLGAGPALGRVLDIEAREAEAAVTVISHEFWQDQLGGSQSVLGQKLQLNGRPVVVVGVMPPEFTGTTTGYAPELWMPIASVRQLQPGSRLLEARDSRSLLVLGRLRDGATPAQAEAALNGQAQRLAELFPQSNRGTSISVLSAREGGLHPLYRSTAGWFVGALQVLVGLVLLIACANVAALLIARALQRQQEIGVRLALGAGRWRLIRMLWSESFVLAALAAVVGVWIALNLQHAVEAVGAATGLPVSLDLRLEPRVLAFAALLALGTSLIFGLVPALQATRPQLVRAIKEPEGAQGTGRSRLLSSLVVLQIGASLVLLTAAGLFLRSLQQANEADLGFDPGAVSVASLDLSTQGYGTQHGQEMFRRLVDALETEPRIAAAALATTLPLDPFGRQLEVRAEDNAGAGERGLMVDYNIVSGRFFETLDLPLVNGRAFSAADRADGPRVAIVNQALARRLWPSGAAVGRRLVSDGETFEVVGVARDSRYVRLDEEHRPYLFLPLCQRYTPVMTAMVRSANTVASGGSPADLSPLIRRAVQELDAALVPFDAQPLETSLLATLLPARAGAIALSAFGGLATLLAAVGLYGLLAFRVHQRLREVGIRLALGARVQDVVRLLVWQGVRLASIGAGLGVVGAVGVGILLSRVLFGVGAFEPLALLVSLLVLGVVALLASWLPARRALRVDPMIVLRSL